MQKNVMKFGAGVLGLVIAGGAVWYGVLLYQERQSPEYALMREYEKLMEAYKNDTYGGATPEETLRLFIDALKAGDTDLAAKYFVVEEQENQTKYLRDVKDKNLIETMVNELQRTELSITEDKAFFSLVGKDGIVESDLIMRMDETKGLWKILEL